jgi:malonyl CoA-acyl carrier protein transacylase
MTRAAIVCPGRGSYTEASLGSLPETHAWVRQAERLRAEYELPSLLALDRAPRFQAALHLRPANVSPLIYLVTMLDAAEARTRHEIVAVLGNSLGWYTALAVAGALSFEDGFRLVQEVALCQEGARGGQLIYPLVGDDWILQPEHEASVARALEAARGETFRSIELGGYAVLAGTEAGLRVLEAELPAVQIGRQSYPLRLSQHGPYHTPLVAGVAGEARERLAALELRPPDVTLIDGRGVRHTPWSASVAALFDYTLGEQITTPFDFTLSVRVTLREYAPELLVLPGPGNTLGGVCGQILVREGWRGIHDRAGFDRVQQGERPVLWSMRR